MLLDYVKVDTFVAGTAIFGSHNYQAAIVAMRLELAKVGERQHGNRRHANKKDLSW
jgi:hypothetical protein